MFFRNIKSQYAKFGNNRKLHRSSNSLIFLSTSLLIKKNRSVKKSLLSLNTLLLLTSSPVSIAEVIENTPYSFTIENKIEVASSINNSWKHFIQDIDKWWPKDHTWWGEKSRLSLDEFAGGCFCEKAESLGHSAEHMRVSHVEKHRLFRMTGGLGPLQGMGVYGALDFSFEKLDSGKTQITLRYQANGYNPKTYEQLTPIVDKVQAMQLGQLGNYLAKLNP